MQLKRPASTGDGLSRLPAHNDGISVSLTRLMVLIQAAFEQDGIQFIDDDEMGGFALRLAKKKRQRRANLQLPKWSFACPRSLKVKLDRMSPRPKR